MSLSKLMESAASGLYNFAVDATATESAKKLRFAEKHQIYNEKVAEFQRANDWANEKISARKEREREQEMHNLQGTELAISPMDDIREKLQSGYFDKIEQDYDDIVAWADIRIKISEAIEELKTRPNPEQYSAEIKALEEKDEQATADYFSRKKPD